MKNLLDEFFPFEEDDYFDKERYKQKREFRLKLADAIEEYKKTKELNLPGLEINMIDIIKKLKSDN